MRLPLFGKSQNLHCAVHDEKHTDDDEDHVYHCPFADYQHNAYHDGQRGENNADDTLGLESAQQSQHTLCGNENAEYDEYDLQKQPAAQHDQSADSQADDSAGDVSLENVQHAQNDEYDAGDGHQPVQHFHAEDTEENTDYDVGNCGEQIVVLLFVSHNDSPYEKIGFSLISVYHDELAVVKVFLENFLQIHAVYQRKTVILLFQR